MQINDLISNPRLTVESIRSSALSRLRPGQIVQARVLSPTSEGSIRLRIGDVDISARTPLKFNVGERLTLSVVRTAAPIELKLIQAASSGEIQARALRSALPRQMPLGLFMDQLGKLSQASESPSRAAVVSETLTPKTAPASDRLSTTLGVSHATANLPPTAAAGKAMPSSPLVLASGVPLQPSTSTSAVTAPLTAATPAGSMISALTQSVQQVLGHHLSAEQPLTPDRLRRAFEQSGLFLEARLARGGNPDGDLKTDLLRLLMQLSLAGGKVGRQSAEAPMQRDNGRQQALPAQVAKMLGEMLNQTEAGLARVLVNQLGALPQAEGTQQTWTFDLPIRQPDGNDNFMLQISRESGASAADTENADTVWSVNLQFDLAGLGPIGSRIRLKGDEISSHFTAELPDTVERLARAMPRLNQALERAGLRVGSLSIGRGRIDDTHAAAERIPRLLDEKA